MGLPASGNSPELGPMTRLKSFSFELPTLADWGVFLSVGSTTLSFYLLFLNSLTDLLTSPAVNVNLRIPLRYGEASSF
jgi:hypothetical protein